MSRSHFTGRNGVRFVGGIILAVLAVVVFFAFRPSHEGVRGRAMTMGPQVPGQTETQIMPQQRVRTMGAVPNRDNRLPALVTLGVLGLALLLVTSESAGSVAQHRDKRGRFVSDKSRPGEFQTTDTYAYEPVKEDPDEPNLRTDVG